jgi:two-component system response regulator YesN
VRNGEKQLAQKLLDQILVDILEKHSENMDTVKTRIVELVVIISRATVDGGANLNKILGLNLEFFQKVLQFTNTAELYLWSKNMLDTFMECVSESKDQKNLQAVQKAADYIKANSDKKITIDEIAQIVYLSPCYLSRIFKQNLGCTLMEYLTQIRVENAKMMLRNPKYNITQVAEESGFEDPGYFTRVFKKIEGITPSRYKHHAL